MLFPSFAVEKGTVLRLISWKHSFNRLNEEIEMAKKKRQALDNLLSSGRISESTYELFNKEISEAIAEIERQQKGLQEKMNSKMKELEEHIKTLEMLFANFEIQHVAGEVDEEAYQREINLISMGLETARHELEAVKEAISQLSTSVQIPEKEVIAQQEIQQTPENVEVPPQKAEVAEEKLPEPPVEPVKVGETESFQASQESTQETLQTTENKEQTKTEAEGGEKQEA